ncbi:CPBP family intramembrane glutamic endopeptidase [Brevibacterium yomogidense]|uniref:CAAX prenyl protease 2/Lysostaphin resistance protein A-like domain-containing protein n=1 Tax=Brevibacterium yomogidense TaxID=946573 RepID=A0A1X6XJ82_9MICO|nr:CPBP family intramembrane glutamic endopeptidase [Brevibacterium yomogidense]SLM99039.1 hypothetical protein FM105_10165 [Brevibacterium yomogidense]
MLELVLFSLPVAIYVLVQTGRRDCTAADALGRVGATTGTGRDHWRGVILFIPLLIAAIIAAWVIPADVREAPGVSIASVASVGAVVGVVLRALGEEVFFRGLLAGVLIRRLGFAWGNLMQALAFLVPHAALLAIDIRLWPILPVQFAVGWVLGHLRHVTGSFLPGALVHIVANVVAGILMG